MPQNPESRFATHLRTFAPSHLRTFAPSHLRTFAPSHLRTFALFREVDVRVLVLAGDVADDLAAEPLRRLGVGVLGGGVHLAEHQPPVAEAVHLPGESPVLDPVAPLAHAPAVGERPEPAEDALGG